MQEVELFVMIDQNGNYVVHVDQTELREAYESDTGEDLGCIATRIIHVKLTVPTPQAITVTASIPAQSETATVSVQ